MIMRNHDALQFPDEAEHHRLRLELSGLPYRPLTPPKHHHIVLHGMRFHYVEWGDRARRPLLFLHGGGQTCRTWDVVCHELSHDYRCIALDPRRDARLLRRSLGNNPRLCPDGRLMWKTGSRRRDERPAVVRDALGPLRERIAGLSCPTLIVRGGDSPILGEEDARRFAEAIPHGRWTAIAGSGHSVQGDQPKALVEALRAFLDEIGWPNHH